MKNILKFLFLFAMFSTAFGQSASEFAKPGQENRPWVFWFWLNGNLTREGIDADLEAMHRVGIGGVIIMEVGQRAPRGPVDYMSDRWQELFRYMITKAASLGIEVNMNSGPGWNGSSGAWIKPENAMKVLSISVVEVPAENRPETIVLPRGEVTFDYYRDNCVLAFPTPKTKTGLGFLPVNNHHQLKTPANKIPADAFVPLDAVIDLTGMMNGAGEIRKGIPQGNWTLIRFGVTCKNTVTKPLLDSGVGPECDKLSKRGIDNSFNGQMAKLIAANRENVGSTLVATHIDSWENGSQNWTDDMQEEFLKHRKYDLRKFLPIFAGYVMENAEYTERFLWDFRRTVSELVLENYAGRMKELAAQNGLRFTCEAYHEAPCDFLQYAGIADEPMGEFWIGGARMDDCRGMASAAHIYGRPIIGAETFTSAYNFKGDDRWTGHPGSIKTRGDQALCEGINRFVFHRYAFQPWIDVRPGMSMGHHGLYYDRTQTWWELTPAWHEYLSRCQYMLRQGEFVADILYLEPEISPQKYNERPRNGYPWDQGNADVVFQASVENGMIVLPSGMKYRLLVLPPTSRMTGQLLEKTLQLVSDGATVIGNHPATEAPGLTDYPNNNRHVKELARKLWGDVKTPTGEQIIGKGKILWGTTPETVLTGMNIVPDFMSDVPLNWIHRRLPDADIYFVANPRDKATLADIQLRGAGKPEFWHPETGKIVQATAVHSNSGSTRLLLPLGATESMFVVLRKSQSGYESRQKLTRVTKDGKQIIDLTAQPCKITITSAKYGLLSDPAKTADVKSLVAKFISNNERQISIDRVSEQMEDPAPKTVKTLVIDYEIGGKHCKVTGKDGETLFLGNMLPAVQVLSAIWGVPGDEKRTADFKEKLQRLFDHGENDIFVRGLAPPDPAPGAIKLMTLKYELNGKTQTWTGNDRDLIFLGNELFTAPVCAPVYDANGKTCIDFCESGKYELTFTSGKKRTETVSLPEALKLDMNWEVAFPHKTVKFDELISWSESADESIRFFSGTATYTKMFSVPENLQKKDLRIILDLGQAETMVQIELNGKYLGVLWKIEKSIDVTEILKSGENHLKISVTNSWPNRLIGDAGLPPSDDRNADGTLKAWPQWLLDGKPDPNGRSTFCMWNLWKKDDDLIPSGLIGSVQLLPVKRIIVE